MWIVGAEDLVKLSDSINYFQLDASCLAHCGSGSLATSSLIISQAVVHLRRRSCLCKVQIQLNLSIREL